MDRHGALATQSGQPLHESEIEDEFDAENDDTFADDAMPSPSSNVADLSEIAKKTAALASKDLLKPPRASASKTSSVNEPPPILKLLSSQGVNVNINRVSNSPTSYANLNVQSGSVNKVLPPSSSVNNTNEAEYTTEQQMKMLDLSLRNVTQPIFVDRMKRFKFESGQSFSYFPQLLFRGIYDPYLVERFDPETLFFMFYYFQQNYFQLLSALALEKLGFLYHKRDHIWYKMIKPNNKPFEGDEDCEVGTFLYFDYKTDWKLKTIEDFTFERRFLEKKI